MADDGVRDPAPARRSGRSRLFVRERVRIRATGQDRCGRLRGPARGIANARGLPTPLLASSRRHERAADDRIQGSFSWPEGARGSRRRERAPRPIPSDRSAPGLQLSGGFTDHELPSLRRLLGHRGVRGLRVLPSGGRRIGVIEAEVMVPPTLAGLCRAPTRPGA